MITPEQKSEIRRLFYAEHHTVNAISVAMGVHHEAVKRALDAEAFTNRSVSFRRRAIDQYMSIITDVMRRLPRVRSTRLLDILRDRGYGGSVHQVRRVAREIRRQHRADVAYLRLDMMAGEQGQCDWGHFGTITTGRVKRKLSCFVMVLSYSRRIFAVFTLDQTYESFLRGHVGAFRDFNGVPRVILYDNLKSAVIERMGQAVRFNPALLELAGHYHFRPAPCNPARGNEKGRVERAIGYLRTGFFAGRTFKDLADANRQLGQWLSSVANVRPWPQDRSRSVEEAFMEEGPRLMRLPEHAPEGWHVRAVRSDKTPYIRFDLNDYTIPHELVRKPLTLWASESEILIFNDGVEIARHPRSYDGGMRIETPSHIDSLMAAKKAALPGRRREALVAMIPQAERLLIMLIDRGEPLRLHLRRLYDLTNEYGTVAVAAAIDIAITRNTPRSDSVEHVLRRADEDSRALPPIPVVLPDRPAVRDLVVRTHALDQYDQLTT